MVQLMPLHPQTLSPLASFKSRLVFPFWFWLTQVVLEKRPLNGCSVVVVVSLLCFLSHFVATSYLLVNKSSKQQRTPTRDCMPGISYTAMKEAQLLKMTSSPD